MKNLDIANAYRKEFRMNKCLLLILSIVPFIPSSILAMYLVRDLEHIPHPIINLQKTNTLSKEQLQDLYRTGHLLSEEGWHHVGRWDSDVWDPYYNQEMEHLRYILEAMHSPNTVDGCGKILKSGDGFFYEKSIIFHYNLCCHGKNYSWSIILYPGKCDSAFNLAQALQRNRDANRKPPPKKPESMK